MAESAPGAGTSSPSPVAFFRRYTKTWVHTVSTAGLTAFGMLTFINGWFAVLAIASYVVPPLALYLRQRRSGSASLPDADASEADRESSAGAANDGLEADDDRRDGAPRSEGIRESDGTSARGTTGDEPGTRSETPATDAGRSGGEAERGVERDEGNRDEGGRSDAASEDPLGAEVLDGAEITGETGIADDDEVPADAEESANEEREPGFDDWREVGGPTDGRLSSAVVTASSAAFAAGAGGTVVRSDDSGEWSVVLRDGPGADGNDLTGVDATDDGAAVWVAGDGGALGRVDVETGRHTDHTAPEGITDNWTDVAVAGPDDDATILLVEGSGGVLRGRYREGDLSWDERTTLGSGSSLSAIDLAESSVGHCCNTNDAVFETADGGESFERVGLEGADGTLEDVAAVGEGRCLVAADDGVLHRYDGSTWTPERLCDAALTGIANLEDRTVVCAEDGTVYERRGAAADWERRTVAQAGLLAVAVGAERVVAVGDEGVVLERTR